MSSDDDVVLPASRLTGFGVAWATFWLLLTTVSVQNYLRQGGSELWQPLLWEGCSFMIASLIVAMQWRLSLRHDSLLAHPLIWFLRNALLWLPLAAPAFVISVYSLRHGAYTLLGKSYEHPGWDVAFRQETLSFSIYYLLFASVIFGIRSNAVLGETRVRLERQLRLTQQAQMLQLTQQLKPHFLFNALNTIASAIYTDPDLADRLLMGLATLLRAASDLARQPETRLDEELRMLEGYATIMRQRFAERVTLSFDIDPRSRSCLVPTLIMQPLLENAFRHGVEAHREMTRVSIRTYRDQHRLHLVVTNDTGQLPATVVLGVGLSNLQQRLQARYGKEASFTLTAGDGGEVNARIELPCAC